MGVRSLGRPDIVFFKDFFGLKNYVMQCNKTWVNDHLRIATTCLLRPPFLSPIWNFYYINDLCTTATCQQRSLFLGPKGGCWTLVGLTVLCFFPPLEKVFGSSCSFYISMTVKVHWNSVITNSVFKEHSVIMNRILSQIGHCSPQISPVITNPA